MGKRNVNRAFQTQSNKLETPLLYGVFLYKSEVLPKKSILLPQHVKYLSRVNIHN